MAVSSDSPNWPGTASLHTIASHGGHPLGVECACGHRALVPLERLGRRHHNMTEIRQLPLRCACGRKGQWIATIFDRAEEAEAWRNRPPVEGAPIASSGGGRPTF